LAWDHRIQHLGINCHPRRSTIADANKVRSEEVFEKIYMKILQRYKSSLPDSRKRSRKNNVYIFDSTSVSLFKEILKGPGIYNKDGKRKGGIKVHTLLHAASDVPIMIRFSAAAASDCTFLKDINLPRGSVLIFDKGFRHYQSYNRFSKEGITWVTRHYERSVFKLKKRCTLTEDHKQQGIRTDWIVELGHNHDKKATKVKARIIKYYDQVSKRYFIFLTNNFKLSAINVAHYYQQRWQIETFFKRVKQNFPLQYFLGDNDNAIKIQIWCTLIADLLLRVIKTGSRTSMAYSNLTSLIRLHLMTYMDLYSFLRAPERSLIKKVLQHQKQKLAPVLFDP
jgi:Transposase DDE domain